MWYKKYIEENEEIRCWFKVSSNRKKLRNIQLWLLEELKRICKKHNIKYYAEWWTLLWAIRHKWFIPRDDDMDFLMFREDYEKFLKVAKKELPKYMKIKDDYCIEKFQIMNIETTAIWPDNSDFIFNKDNMFGIRIDVFPIDYASKYMAINKIKSFLLRFLYAIAMSKTANDNIINKMPIWKKILLKVNKFIFKKIDYKRLSHIYQKINKKVFFKWEKVIAGWCSRKYYPAKIFDKIRDVYFENTTISICNWYNEYLKITYWDYMKPIIFEWWHSIYYSVNLSYKDIIKWFEKNKKNQQIYSDCKSLFML